MAPRWLLVACFVGMAVTGCGDDEGIQSGGDAGPGDGDAGAGAAAAGGGGRAGAPVSGRGGVGGGGRGGGPVSGRGGAGSTARPTDCATVQTGGPLETWCSRDSETRCDLSLGERREQLCRTANSRIVEVPNSCGGTTLTVVQLYGVTYHHDGQDDLIGLVSGGHGCVEEVGAIPGIDYARYYGERCTTEFEKSRDVDCSALDLDAGI